MIDRYTRPELGAIWTDEARMTAWRDVEVAAAEALAGPAPDELEAIRAATFTVEAVKEREQVTDHDVAAFVDVLSASAGTSGRWIHFGLTSSDVLDTALALQLRRAGDVIVPGARAVAGRLAERAREHAGTVCVGRTHGVHAEPTSFGLKLAGFAFEAHRNAERLERAGGGDLDVAPCRHPRLVGPDGADLGPCVAVDHASRMRAASTAALRAESTPTQATGTPGGIWAIESSASSPPATEREDVSGTPMTGSVVCAATTPGSAAERPAPAMITRSPRSFAFFA